VVCIFRDPVDKLELIERLKANILDEGRIKNEVVAEQMAREWVQRLEWNQKDAS
jgi:hypothetical protein